MKLYANEVDSAAVRSFDRLAVAELARVEVAAAIWRKHRLREISAPTAALLVSDFEADYLGLDGQHARFIVISLKPDILDRAARLVAVHGLRAYDAVQFGTACVVSEAVPDLTFLSFDKALNAAAAAEGIALADLPP